MSNIAIKAENLSKAYQLGEIGTGTISRDLERWYARIRGKEDPFLRIGETNDRTSKGTSDIVWSLKDINFEIEQGDAVGIIGRNGAGKSTLLKVLSRVTSPTAGRITGKGRIASLLEVGTGFHPELTGRENIYLNGAILGMRKKEIIRKFDEIVDFAGVERYIDTPVKRYSSGMYVRLAFAVAAHLESEILIVDEVLAVGDAEFQKKCLGKMGEVSKGEGRTVLFVSHNMGSIEQLCNKGILLKNGSINFSGSGTDCINKYLISEQQNAITDLSTIIRRKNQHFEFTDIKFKDSGGTYKNEFQIGDDLVIEVFFNSTEHFKEALMSRIDIGINDVNNHRITWLSTSIFSNKIHTENKISFHIKKFNLNAGLYNITLFCETDFGELDWIKNVSKLTLIPSDYYKTGTLHPTNQGHILCNYTVNEHA
ncbi:ABC transporter ATP-binding protein [Nubsella zeaxanthinifaciens]|uniref:ABC transporter ATP-binding protein n=1 Tax=Nubsella zeaxanthinifaciens TaxID=392412 RepID=UPI003D04FD49